MTTATLPATERRIPDTDWSIASYKGHLTHDGEAYVASLRRNGKKVASIQHDGCGGVPIVYWAETATEHRQAWQKWVADYDRLHAAESWGEPEYASVEALIEEHQLAAQLRRATRKETPVLKPGANILETKGYIALRGCPTDPRVQAYLREHTDQFDRYWDGSAWVRP